MKLHYNKIVSCFENVKIGDSIYYEIVMSGYAITAVKHRVIKVDRPPNRVMTFYYSDGGGQTPNGLVYLSYTNRIRNLKIVKAKINDKMSTKN